MSTGTTTQTRAQGQAQRGRTRRGNKGRNAGLGSQCRNDSSKAPVSAEAQTTQDPTTPAAEKAEKPSEADDGTVCWICAEPVKYYSVSQCNHRTCHVCALRLRALYKKLECTFCKVGHKREFSFFPDSTMFPFIGTTTLCHLHYVS